MFFWRVAFPFENFLVYRKALDWVELAETVCAAARRRVSADLLDQLRRASSSVVLNVAEGAAKWGPDRQRFFKIARGSLFECVPIVQIIHRRALIKNDDYKKTYALLEELGKMLTTLSKAPL